VAAVVNTDEKRVITAASIDIQKGFHKNIGSDTLKIAILWRINRGLQK